MIQWQILDVGSIWMKEFAHAFCKVENARAWVPKFSNVASLARWGETEQLTEPPLQIEKFPLQRGYSRMVLRTLLPFQHKLTKRLMQGNFDPRESPLVCTTPFYAPVAELWPGPVIYYSTDLTIAYDGIDPNQVRKLDARLCRAASLVCPNSNRIAQYFIEQAGCSAEKIKVIPNATRATNISAQPRYHPGALPDDVKDSPRPIVGIVGDLSGNLDWLLIKEAMQQTSEMSWVFVGPTDRTIEKAPQREAREWAKAHGRFLGMKPYGDLQRYAQCLDVAVLPYMKREPTFSGSSTRFYEHLAAGRPMIATRGFAELLEKEPLLKLVDSGEELAQELRALRAMNFCDGNEKARWEASLSATWDERARSMCRALQELQRKDVRTAAESQTTQLVRQ
jgi:glycosyltransferase involved in cell wall biosynthesis